MKTQLLRRTKKTVSAKGRKERKGVKRRKRKKRSGKGNARRSVRGSVSGRGRETETESGTEIKIGGQAEATQTAVIPVEHPTGSGADPVIVGGPGAETRKERGNADGAGIAPCSFNK